MKKFIGTLLCAGLVGSAFSQILNGGFENGIGGWSAVGNVQVLGSELGSSPYAGSRQALIASYTDASSTVSGGTGAVPVQLASFTGASSAAYAAVQGQGLVVGSAVSQSIHLNAGNTVSFYFSMLTNQLYDDGTNLSQAPDPNNNDFTFLTVVAGSTGVTSNGLSSVQKLADVFDGYSVDAGRPSGFNTSFTITDPANPFISELGYRHASFTATSTDNYQLSFGLAHVASNGIGNGIGSAMLLDNVTVTPEPSSMIALGGFALAMFRKRKQK